MIFVGADWAKHKHDFLLMDAGGAILEHLTIRHEPSDLQGLADRIAEHEADPAEVHVGYELHDGALLAWMLSQGYTVYAINPKSANRARDMYHPAGGKDDKGDCLVLADMVRNNRRRFRPIHGDSQATLELKSFSRFRRKLVEQRTAHIQQLRALLDEWHPSLSRLCNDLSIGWQQVILSMCPTHEELRDLHGNRLNAFFRKHRLRESTRERIRQVRSEVGMLIPTGRQEAIRVETLYLAETIQRLTQHIRQTEKKLDHAVQCHPDSFIFQSLPVKGAATTASLMAAFGEDRQNTPHWRKLAARWGVAPVTRQSGKSKTVRRRIACDHNIQQALQYFSFNTAFVNNCWAKEYYQQKRAAGVKHFTALRCLTLRWIKILYRIWMDRTTYDDELHRTSRRLRGAAG